MSTFDTYLQSKKINAEAFRRQDPVRYQEWEKLHAEVHVASFEAQKKFLINPTRRKYPLVHDKL